VETRLSSTRLGRIKAAHLIKGKCARRLVPPREPGGAESQLGKKSGEKKRNAEEICVSNETGLHEKLRVPVGVRGRRRKDEWEAQSHQACRGRRTSTKSSTSVKKMRIERRSSTRKRGGFLLGGSAMGRKFSGSFARRDPGSREKKATRQSKK